MTMSQADLFYRCMTLIALLDQELQWGLTDQQREQYVRALVTLVAPSDPDAIVRIIAENYHKDHRRVSILNAPDHPEYPQIWDGLRSDLLAIIYTKRLHWSRDQAVTLEDLVQMAYQAAVQSLPNFGFRARFFTWLTTVVVRTLVRRIRADTTQKRAAEVESLDAQAEVEHAVPETIDAEVGYRLLVEQVKQMLRAQRDKRLVDMFELRFCKDVAPKDIAAQFGLSAQRARALLDQIKQLIADDPSLRQWEQDE